jgi:hypothetical protein
MLQLFHLRGVYYIGSNKVLNDEYNSIFRLEMRQNDEKRKLKSSHRV